MSLRKNANILLFSYIVVNLFGLDSNKALAVTDHLDKAKSIGIAISTLEKSVGFYKQRFAEVNLDSVFGIRVAEGYLKKILDGRAKISALSSKQLKRVRNIYDSFKSVAKKSIRILKKEKSSYFDKFKILLQKEWSYVEPSRTIDYSLIDHRKKKNKGSDLGFNEQTSDRCIASVMGSDPSSKTSCTYPDDCWICMTQRNTGQYYITHQALYFLLSEVKGCHNEVIKNFGDESKRNAFVNYLAANIFDQMKTLLENGIDPDDRDLFLEQGIVLAMLGVHESMDARILSIVAKWQHKSGCMKDPPKGSKPDVGRKLLVERKLKGGCLSHASGLSVGFFAMYLHWLTTDSYLAGTTGRNGISLLGLQFAEANSGKSAWQLSTLLFSYAGLVVIGGLAFIVYIRLKKRRHILPRHLRLI